MSRYTIELRVIEVDEWGVLVSAYKPLVLDVATNSFAICKEARDVAAGEAVSHLTAYMTPEEHTLASTYLEPE